MPHAASSPRCPFEYDQIPRKPLSRSARKSKWSFRSVLGLLLGMSTSVLAGLLLAHCRTAYAVLDLYFVGFNSLPRPALAPILILWFGLGLTSKVFQSWLLVFFIVFYNTIYGLEHLGG